jgi:hypothetical protein
VSGGIFFFFDYEISNDSKYTSEGGGPMIGFLWDSKGG